VVRQGQMVLQVAQRAARTRCSRARRIDAPVPKEPPVTLALADDPTITRRVTSVKCLRRRIQRRETYVVKVGLDNPRTPCDRFDGDSAGSH